MHFAYCAARSFQITLIAVPRYGFRLCGIVVVGVVVIVSFAKDRKWSMLNDATENEFGGGRGRGAT